MKELLRTNAPALWEEYSTMLIGLVDSPSPFIFGLFFIKIIFVTLTGVALFYLALHATSNIIDRICNITYIYNICWEDPAVDHQILKINKDDVIFRICSAGDVVLDYAIEGPSKIVVCDTNQHQLWLFELKICMLRDTN